MPPPEAADSLAPDRAARLAEFARACKSATRMVSLYPRTHPSIHAALSRLVEASRQAITNGPLVITVLPDTLQVNGRGLARAEVAVDELAALLHQHRVGTLTLRGAVPPDGWHTLLSLLARSPEEVHADGGLSRAWEASNIRAVELTEIDYAEVLREREDAQQATWESILANCLEEDEEELTPEALLELAGDAERLRAFIDRQQERMKSGGMPVTELMHALANYAAQQRPDDLDGILDRITEASTLLTADNMLTLVNAPPPSIPGGAAPLDLANELRSRITDDQAGQFVAGNIIRDSGATQRLAMALKNLVVDPARREDLLPLAHDHLRNTADAAPEAIEEMWSSSVEMLKSYSDEQFVTADYAQELTSAPGQALAVEHSGDDPPARVDAWVATVHVDAVATLGQQVLIDLLLVETREDEWQDTLDAAIAQISAFVESGRLALAIPLHQAVVDCTTRDSSFTPLAKEGLSHLTSGPLATRLVAFMRDASDADAARAAEFCKSIGPDLLGPLSGALAGEDHARTIRHLRAVLVSFGPAARAYANELRRSSNPQVRRVAIDLWRTLGSADVLGDLRTLLDDAAPQIQREALRAIVQIGTDEAYATLDRALKTGAGRTRDAILQGLGSFRDERAAPLLIHMLSQSGYRGALEGQYTTLIDTLGRIGSDRASAEALRVILYRGEWWARGRTARLRAAAARALRAAGSEAASEVLNSAGTSGPGGVKRAARAALAEPAPLRTAARRTT